MSISSLLKDITSSLVNLKSDFIEAFNYKKLEVDSSLPMSDYPNLIKTLKTDGEAVTNYVTPTIPIISTCGGELVSAINNLPSFTSTCGGELKSALYQTSSTDCEVYGYITVEDNIASNFNGSYLILPKSDIFLTASPDFTVQARFKTSDFSAQQALWHGEYVSTFEITTSGKIYTYCWSPSTAKEGSYTIQADTWYIAEMIYDSASQTKTYYLYSDNKEELLDSFSFTEGRMECLNTSYNFQIGFTSYNYDNPWLGSIDLNNFHIINTTDGTSCYPSVTVYKV